VTSPETYIAFVLGGGGHLGAVEVGMLQALLDEDIRPDLVLGTSVGAINGCLVAQDPSPAAARQLTELWQDIGRDDVFGGSVFGRITTLARTGTALHSHDALKKLLERTLSVQRIEDLAVPFQCVAASIESASEHWFTSGPLIDAVLASAAVPGLLPPYEIDGEHFLDGGIVNSIPVGRAVELGATDVYVLQVGRVERPLSPPTRPWEVGLVAFEIARRHRFAGDMAALPAGVTVHVMPGGDATPPRYNDLSNLKYRDFSQVARRISSAYDASRRYLADDIKKSP
jgi:NTE family protein